MNNLGVTESCKILEDIKLLVRQLSEKEEHTAEEIIRLRNGGDLYCHLNNRNSSGGPDVLIHFYTGIKSQIRQDIKSLSKIIKENAE